MNKLIVNIWNKYHKTPITEKIEREIMTKAKHSFRKAKGKVKLSTFVSWWARQRASIK